jgi:hypothetical protein
VNHGESTGFQPHAAASDVGAERVLDRVLVGELPSGNPGLWSAAVTASSGVLSSSCVALLGTHGLVGTASDTLRVLSSALSIVGLQLAVAAPQWLVVAGRPNARRAVRALGVLLLAGACFLCAQTPFEGKNAVVIGCMGLTALAFGVTPFTRSYTAFAHHRFLLRVAMLTRTGRLAEARVLAAAHHE